MAVPQWSNQTYLTLQLLRSRARLTKQLAASDSAALSTTLDGGAPASGSGPGQRGEGL